MISGPKSYRDFRETGPWTVYPYPQFFRKKTGSPRRAVPTNKNISFQTKSAPGAEWNTNKPKQKDETKMKYIYEQQ